MSPKDEKKSLPIFPYLSSKPPSQNYALAFSQTLRRVLKGQGRDLFEDQNSVYWSAESFSLSSWHYRAQAG